MRRGDDLHPARHRQLVGAQLLTHAIIQNFRGGAWDASQPFVLHHAQIVAQRQASFLDAVINLHRREGMNVHFRNRALDGPQQIPVVKSVEILRQPALNANLRGAAIPGFERSPHDFAERERISVRCSGPASKPAKTAPHETHVGEIDVAVHDVGDRVADRLPPQSIGNGNQRIERRAFRHRKLQRLLKRQFRTSHCGKEMLSLFCRARFNCRQRAFVHRGSRHFMGIVSEETPGLHSPRQSPATPSP